MPMEFKGYLVSTGDKLSIGYTRKILGNQQEYCIVQEIANGISIKRCFNPGFF
jgi:hypothetical protein